MKILESAENYLETILMLSQKNNYVRSIDIANELNYSKPSVSVAMKKLRESELITVDENGHIALTEKGLSIANTMYERHSLLSNWLINLGVPEDIALEDACRIEHVISEESFSRIREHAEIMAERLKNIE